MKKLLAVTTLLITLGPSPLSLRAQSSSRGTDNYGGIHPWFSAEGIRVDPPKKSQ